MRDLAVLVLHLFTTIVRLAGPDGALARWREARQHLFSNAASFELGDRAEDV